MSDRNESGEVMRRHTKAGQGSPKVLLVGYNGANNTGAEAKLLSIIDDVRAVLGRQALITIPTLNEEKLRRYIKEGPLLRVAPIPSLYVLAFRRLVRRHDLIILTEGSTYMDTWTSALLWAYLWVTRCAHSLGKPCLAYAVDSGHLSEFNQRLVRREASKTDLIVTRNQAAADSLHRWGVTAPVEVTADNAFTFRTDPADDGLVEREWPEASRGLVGIAPVNFYQWPVVLRPWGRKEDCYKWPYYFSHSPERLRDAEELADEFAALAGHMIREHGKAIALICMEELDEPFARKIQERLADPEQVRIFSARRYNASQMAVLLRRLDLLVTSRYHAAVLSLAGQVPQVALGHDSRLESLYGELGLREGYFVKHGSENMFGAIRERADQLLGDPSAQSGALARGLEAHVLRARRNPQLLGAFVERHGLAGVSPETRFLLPRLGVAT